MKVYRSLAELPADFGPSAVSIGNFDGVHFGHRKILRRVHAIEAVLILPFSEEVAHLTPEEFAQRLLVDAMQAKAVLVGDNFRFGHKAAGNVRMLAELGERLGFITEVVPAISCRGRVVSSSGIRDLIRAGNVSLAARFLLHPYGVEGQVVSGRGVGSKQTVPTLNLATAAEVIPAAGVYVTRTRDLEGGREWHSITNAGYRPTFGESEQLTIETFLLDPLEGDTPARIRVEFLRRVRAERKFDSPESLRAQILKDVRTAQSYFRRARAWTGRECISC
jgi:riboflavin kinase/FMN adenylyltransferase